MSGEGVSMAMRGDRHAKRWDAKEQQVEEWRIMWMKRRPATRKCDIESTS
jgi:hypothetical protein